MDREATSKKFKMSPIAQGLFILFGVIVVVLIVISVMGKSESHTRNLQFIIMIVMLILGFLEIRSTNRSMSDVAEVAERIGEGDYKARSAVDSEAAVGQLSRSVNKMAQKIEEAVSEIEASRKQLSKSQAELERQNQQLASEYDRQSRFGEFLADLSLIDIKGLADKALPYFLEAAGAQSGALFIREENDALTCLAVQGSDDDASRAMAQDACFDGLPSQVERRRQWIFLDHIKPEAMSSVDLGTSSATRQSVFGIPIIFRNEVLAVVILASERKPDMSQLQSLTNHVEAFANSLNNACNYKAINRQSFELERVNQELREASRVRSEFVANMSHELRTPLNSIIGFSGILLKNGTGGLQEKDVSRAEKINRNGKHLLKLINDILDLSKVEAGKMEVNFSDINLVQVLAEVKDIIQPQAEQKGIDLILKAPEESVRIVTDDHRLKQIVINMVGNAVKFTSEGRVSIELETGLNGGLALGVHVRDTGIGIPQDKLETIFGAFRQADNTTTREYGGTGLGLAIAKSMIELIGGQLSVQSELGKGSCFSAILPVAGPCGAERTSHAEIVS